MKVGAGSSELGTGLTLNPSRSTGRLFIFNSFGVRNYVTSETYLKSIPNFGKNSIQCFKIARLGIFFDVVPIKKPSVHDDVNAFRQNLSKRHGGT